MSPLDNKLYLPLHFQQQQCKQCFAFVAKSYCSVIYSFFWECTGLFCPSTAQAYSDTKGTSAAADSSSAVLHLDTLFLMRKAQSDGTIEMQQPHAGSSGRLKCRFSCSDVQYSTKAKHRHCLGASPLRALDADVGEWSIPHTRKGVFSDNFSRISLSESS